MGQMVFICDVVTRMLSQVASSSSMEHNWTTYSFIHSVKHNKLGSYKIGDLVYVHSNLHCVSHKGEECTSGLPTSPQ